MEKILKLQEEVENLKEVIRLLEEKKALVNKELFQYKQGKYNPRLKKYIKAECRRLRVEQPGVFHALYVYEHEKFDFSIKGESIILIRGSHSLTLPLNLILES